MMGKPMNKKLKSGASETAWVTSLPFVFVLQLSLANLGIFLKPV